MLPGADLNFRYPDSEEARESRLPVAQIMMDNRRMQLPSFVSIVSIMMVMVARWHHIYRIYDSGFRLERPGFELCLGQAAAQVGHWHVITRSLA